MKIAIIVVIIIAIIIFLLCKLGFIPSLCPVPQSITIEGPAQIANNTTATYTVTVTLKDSSVGRGILNIRVEEDDNWDDDLALNVPVTFANKAISASTTVDLQCNSNVLKGPAGESDEETQYQVHAEVEQNAWPNTASRNIPVSCVQETPPEPPGE